MSTIEELKAKHGAKEYPPPPLRLCPSCFLIDYHESKEHASQCAECNRWSDNPFPQMGTPISSALILEALREAVAGKDMRALNAWKIVVDDWEWKK